MVFNSTKYFSIIKNGILHLTYVSIISVTGFKNVKFHVKGDVDNYSKKEIDEILEGVAEMLDCEKRDILVNGVLPSMSFIIVLSINEAYIWRLNVLSKQDCNKLRRLNIDYLIVDQYRFFFESTKGKMVNYFIKHVFFLRKQVEIQSLT